MKKMGCKYTSIGGQALIEGIMMKSPEKTALAVRTPNGEIDISYLESKSLKDRFKILKLPIIRGVVAYIESMSQGFKAMMISADKSGFTELEEEAERKKREEKLLKKGKTLEDDKKKENIITSIIMGVGAVLGIVLSVVLFMLLPRLLVDGLEKLFSVAFKPVVRSVIAQFIKFSIFVFYIWIVSFMKDIRRVFMYHGAEHKTIFCYEKGLELNVENVRKQSRFHPRCGTSFLILMILVGIVFSTVAQYVFPDAYKNPFVWVATTILMIPVICGTGYEVLRFCGKYDNTLTRIISAPGIWIQRITTKSPDDDMIEIAIAALRACEPENPDVDRSVDQTTEETPESNDAL